MTEMAIQTIDSHISRECLPRRQSLTRLFEKKKVIQMVNEEVLQINAKL